MNFIKFELDQDRGNYFCRESLSVNEGLLAIFLLTDIRLSSDSALFYKDWAFNDALGMGLSGNCTFLEKDGEYIYLSDLFPEDEDDLVQLKISRKLFAEILSDWKEKVCKKKPMEVIIRYGNNVFTIETKEDTVEEKEEQVPQEELKIDYVELSLINNETYSCKEMTDLEMGIIGNLFIDIGCSRENLFYYQDWPFADSFGVSAETKNIALRKERDYIFLVDKNDQTTVKMSRHYLAQLVSDWEEKVYRTKAKEVIINRKNGEFSIEIKK